MVAILKGARHTRKYHTVTPGLSVLVADTKDSTYCPGDAQKRSTHHAETSRGSLPMATRVEGDVVAESFNDWGGG